jgi:AraC-like DNA-binding protein
MRGYAEEAPAGATHLMRSERREEAGCLGILLRAWLAALRGEVTRALDIARDLLFYKELSDTQTTAPLVLMGVCFAQLGRWELALECVDKIEDFSLAEEHPAMLAAGLLRGEILLRRAIQHAARECMNRNGRVKRRFPPASYAFLHENAAACFEKVHEHSGEFTLFSRLAIAGATAARSLGVTEFRTASRLETHLQWLQECGFTFLHRVGRSTLGMLHFVADDHRLARVWLIPLASEAQFHVGGPFDRESLQVTAFLLETPHPRSAVAALCKYLREQEARLAAADALVGRFDLASIIGGRRMRKSVRGPSLIEAVEQHVLDSLDRRQSVDELALVTGVSRRKLELSFRTLTGQSPRQFIIELKLLQARRMMEQHVHISPKILRGIARRTGFASYRRFEANFVRAFGFAPDETCTLASSEN